MKLVSSDTISENLVELLTGVELGTNGAKYVHLDIKERIKEADHPLSFSLERNNRLIANITFCVRDTGYYLRYFTFSSAFQSQGSKNKSAKRKPSQLEKEISRVFQNLISNKPSFPLYAYIDYDNDRSRLFSERFGFENYSDIVSRTYSRINPKKNQNITLIDDWEAISEEIKAAYGADEFYHEAHIKKGPYLVLKNDKGVMIACAKFSKVHWRIISLPGRYGSFLVKILPFIPFLNRLIKPKDHFFLVPDVVLTKNNSSEDIETLFDSALDLFKVNSLIWFIDPNKPIYKEQSKRIKWGILDKILGEKKVAVVTLNHKSHYSEKKPVFVSAFDLI